MLPSSIGKASQLGLGGFCFPVHGQSVGAPMPTPRGPPPGRKLILNGKIVLLPAAKCRTQPPSNCHNERDGARLRHLVAIGSWGLDFGTRV